VSHAARLIQITDDLEIMTKTLQSTLAPLFIISSFCCLGLFEYPLGQPRPYFSCLYILVIWSNIIYVAHPIFVFQWQNGLDVDDWFADVYQLVIISLILITFYRFKVKILKCYSLVPNIS